MWEQSVVFGHQRIPAGEGLVRALEDKMVICSATPCSSMDLHYNRRTAGIMLLPLADFSTRH